MEKIYFILDLRLNSEDNTVAAFGDILEAEKFILNMQGLSTELVIYIEERPYEGLV